MTPTGHRLPDEMIPEETIRIGNATCELCGDPILAHDDGLIFEDYEQPRAGIDFPNYHWDCIHDRIEEIAYSSRLEGALYYAAASVEDSELQTPEEGRAQLLAAFRAVFDGDGDRT